MLRSLAPCLLLVVGSTALAGPFEEHLAQARTDVAAREYRSAMGHLDAADRLAPGLDYTVSTHNLAQVPYLMGLVEHLQGDPKDRAMDHWRAALVIDGDFAWDENLLDDPGARDLFLALGNEVAQRPQVSTGVPASTGAARIFVDGVRKRAGDTVREGRHLGQIVCPDGSVHGTWTDDPEKVRWFRMCPGGVDTSVVVADEEPAEDDWGDLGPQFGTTQVEPPPPVPVEPTGADAALPATDEPVLVRRKIYWPLLAGAGATAIASGALYAVAYRDRQAFDDLGNTELVSEAAIRDLAQKTNREVGISAGLGVVAAGLYISAFIQW